MKIINFILDLFRLFYLSIYKRTKGLNAKSRFFAYVGYIFILNFFFNLYFIDKYLQHIVGMEKSFYTWRIIHILIFLISTIIVVYFDFKFKKDKRFIFKYRKIITHSVFEYILFVLFFIFVFVVHYFDENSVF